MTPRGRSLKTIVHVEPDGTLVLECGHRKPSPGPCRWGRRTSCRECVPEVAARPWPQPKRGALGVDDSARAARLGASDHAGARGDAEHDAGDHER